MTTLEELRATVRLADNTRNAERWSGEEWIALRKAYIACEHDLAPDRWSYHQTEAAIRSGTVPRFDYHGNALPFIVEASDPCPACGQTSSPLSGWVTGDCGHCGAPLEVRGTFAAEIQAVLAQLDALEIGQRATVLKMALDTLESTAKV